MRIDEIIVKPADNWNPESLLDHVRKLDNTKKDGSDLLSWKFLGYSVFLYSIENVRYFIIADSLPNDDLRKYIKTIDTLTQSQIVLIAGFLDFDKVWQAKNILVTKKYQGSNLAVKFYLEIKNKFGIALASDYEQSPDGVKLWSDKLPLVISDIKVWDTEIQAIAPKITSVQVYTSGMKYIWIIP